MVASPYVLLDNTTQNATQYKANIDGNSLAAYRFVNDFLPRAQDTPNMTVKLEAGHIYNQNTQALTEVGAQSTLTITAPVGNPRIDRIVVDRFTGAASVVTGTPAGSPVAPAIPAGAVPVARVLLQTTTTAIGNSMITDERNLNALGLGNASTYDQGEVSGALPLWQNTRWNKAPIQSKSANYTVVSADRGSVIYFTAGGKTLNMDASGLGAGFVVGVSGTAVITSLSNAAGGFLMPGMATGVIASPFSFTCVEHTIWLVSTGTDWLMIAGQMDMRNYATYTPTVTTDYVRVLDATNGLEKRARLDSIVVPSGCTLLATKTGTGVSEFDFTSVMGSTYDDYQLRISSLVLSSTTAATKLMIQVSTNNGSTWINSGYVNTAAFLNNGSPGYIAETTGIPLKDNTFTMAGSPIRGTIDFSNINNVATTPMVFTGLTSYKSTLGTGTPMVSLVINGEFDTTGSNVNAVRLIVDTGTFTGTARLYGMKN